MNFVPMMLVDEIKKLNKQLGIPEKLSDVGVTEDKIDVMAEDAMKGQANIMANPRQTTLKDCVMLYKKAL
ncbi:MAG: iron-containing alcohol dehydrogenase, partial [Oribacterium sp.]|nr:iron-containing alcohol dehydrogenase [Oribacterium sp.]